MDTSEQSRKRLAQKREHDEHQQDRMRSRAEAELDQGTSAEAFINEQTREAMTQRRRHEKHQKESILNRAEEELKQRDQ